MAYRKCCFEAPKLFYYVNSIINEGGEGIVMRKIGSMYIHGLSTDLLKVKARQGDTEALVIDSKDNAISLQLPQGEAFQIPKHQSPFPIHKGDIITIAYNSFKRRRIPVDPVIICKRNDLNWDNIVEKRSNYRIYSNYLLVNPQLKYKEKLKTHKTRLKQGHYRGIQNHRNFFLEFAQKHNFDPLVANNWYNFTLSSFQEIRLGIKNYSGDVAKVLLHMFPDIGLDPVKLYSSWSRKLWKKQVSQEEILSDYTYQIQEQSFRNTVISLFPKIRLKNEINYWKSIDNRRKFFIEFATKKGFDPLVSENWKNITRRELTKQGYAFSRYYSSVQQALFDVFPNIGKLEKKTHRPQYWHSVNNRRNFFIDFAAIKGFDPFVPTNWDNVTHKELNNQGGRSILQYHSSFNQALLDLFSWNFGKIKLKRQYNDYWQSTNNRRNFFIEFAAQKGFDPLVSNNWNNFTCMELRKGGRSILRYHRTFKQALVDLFPDMGMLCEKDATAFFENNHTGLWNYGFQNNRRDYNFWKDTQNRRNFLIEFASHKGFDPLVPTNWNKVTNKELTMQGGRSILQYHSTIKRAVLELFPDRNV